MAKKLITRAELARILGISKPRITKYVQNGFIEVLENGKIDLDEALKALEKRLDPSKKRGHGVNLKPTAPIQPEASSHGKEAQGIDFFLEKARSEHFKALLLEIEYLEKKSIVVDLETASKLWERVIMSCRSRLLAMPSKMAPELFSCKSLPEVKELLEKNIHEALKELAAIDPADYCAGLKGEAIFSASPAYGERVGGSKKNAQSGGLRGARAMVHI